MVYAHIRRKDEFNLRCCATAFGLNRHSGFEIGRVQYLPVSTCACAGAEDKAIRLAAAAMKIRADLINGCLRLIFVSSSIDTINIEIEAA